MHILLYFSLPKHNAIPQYVILNPLKDSHKKCLLRIITIIIIFHTYPMVVMKLVVKESSVKRNSRQLFPTPAIQSKLSCDLNEQMASNINHC